MGKAGIDTSHVMLAVAAQDRGLVVLRIDADAEQLRLAERLRIFLQLLHDLAEVVAHTYAIVGKRTTRVDEGEQQRFAAKLMEVDGLATLVDQREVGHLVAGLRNTQRRGSVAFRVAGPGEADVLQFGMVTEHQGRVDVIAGRNCLEYPVVGLAHRERHGHAFHQAGNVLVSDGQLAVVGIDRDHAAFQLIALGRRSIGTGGQGKQEK